ncbi:ATP-dependent DNA ligase [Streptomyces xiamenensis]|uniref:ATP-dependent DNA ligase n=1 Tax=Streptomyces xiamenensis TaxID=408015 RepID=UPI0036E59414
MRLPTSPMLTKATTRLPPWGSHAAEPKWDGFRALLGRWSDGRAVLRSRQGTDMSTWFPELIAAAEALPGGNVLLDGEVVAWSGSQFAFERLLARVNASAARAGRLAAEQPCHFVTFDLLHQGEADLLRRPYRARRAALEQFLVKDGRPPLFELCPSSSDPAEALQWLKWTPAGVEGLVFKCLEQAYVPGHRGWLKWRTRASTEAVIGAVTGTVVHPGTVLLGRLDASGRLRFVGRTTPLAGPAAVDLGHALTAAGNDHPWTGRTFSAGWGRSEPLQVTLVTPGTVAEVSADTSLDVAGRWRHPVRFLRPRPDLAPMDAPVFGARNEPAGG